jgi:N-acetylglucosaminyl-diphospho-decaprenol L-rhamnosyltransferase
MPQIGIPYDVPMCMVVAQTYTFQRKLSSHYGLLNRWAHLNDRVLAVEKSANIASSAGQMLSISIVNWNTCDLLRRCLESINSHLPTEPCEIIVVDNASSDGSADMVQAQFPSVILLRQNSNVGYAAANNIAIQRAKGEWILLLNPDTAFEDESLEISLGRLKALPSVGALAIKLVGEDGRTQRSIRAFPRPLPILFEIAGLSKLFPRSSVFAAYRAPTFNYESEGPAEQPMGTYLLFRKEAIDAVGPMDERFPIFFNDVDLLWRLNRIGWQIWYTPQAHVRHLGGGSTKQVRRAMIWESHISLERYYWKWYSRWWNWPLLLVFSLLLRVGAFLRARGPRG